MVRDEPPSLRGNQRLVLLSVNLVASSWAAEAVARKAPVAQPRHFSFRETRPGPGISIIARDYTVNLWETCWQPGGNVCRTLGSRPGLRQPLRARSAWGRSLTRCSGRGYHHTSLAGSRTGGRRDNHTAGSGPEVPPQRLTPEAACSYRSTTGAQDRPRLGHHARGCGPVLEG